MKIFLSGCESEHTFRLILDRGIKPLYTLMSYYYLRKNLSFAELVRDSSKEVLIDSGAHSLQRGMKVDWVSYTKEYAEFIKKFDRKNIVGFFEMDVDNIIGYQKVLELRKILESVSDKIIPVWHKNRGIEDFKKTCEQYKGKIVGITGAKNDIDSSQYMNFLKYAKKFNTKIHCLAMTKIKIISQVPFDYTDSSTWLQQGVFGNYNTFKDGKFIIQKVKKSVTQNNRTELDIQNYIAFKKLAEYYHEFWRKECND